jgi:hypothetical protein
MSDQVTGGGADPKPIVGDESGKKDTAFEAVKAEKRALAEENAKIKAQLEKIENEKRLKDEEAQKARGEYKTLWETSEADKKALAEKLQEKEAKELNLRKIDVVMKEIGSPLLKPEYWNLVNLERIPFDPATNDIDLNIARQEASDFVKKYPELIKGKVTKLPGEAPSVSAGGITKAEWAKLGSSKEMKARLKDVIK